MTQLKDTGKRANPLNLKIGSILFDHSQNPPEPVTVDVFYETMGVVDFIVQGINNTEYIVNYVFDSHDYTGDGPEYPPLTLARK